MSENTTIIHSVTNEPVQQKNIVGSSTTLGTTLLYLKQLISDKRLDFAKYFNGERDDSQHENISPVNFSEETHNESDPFFMMSELVMHTAKLSERLNDGSNLSLENSERESDLVYRLVTSAVNARLAGADAIFQELKKRHTH